eukprot:2555522-Rhodomonas_salina.3
MFFLRGTNKGVCSPSPWGAPPFSNCATVKSLRTQREDRREQPVDEADTHPAEAILRRILSHTLNDYLASSLL